jgi:colanic acid/amylovoran biosynthesis protein
VKSQFAVPGTSVPFEAQGPRSSSARPTGDAWPRLLLSGAPPTSTNRGVGALCAACVDQLTRVFPTAALVVGGAGVAPKRCIELPDRTVEVETSWLTGTSQLKQRSGARHLLWIRRLSRLAPELGKSWLTNRTYQQLDSCNAMLEIAGGDSFADTYGMATLIEQAAVKRLAFVFDKPLIMLPQTIGPFRDGASQRIARDILERSALVATREADGLRELEELLGKELDHRFLACPDVAFTLRPKPLTEARGPWNDGDGRPIIGLNVSGLLWRSNVDFGLSADYQALTRQLIDWVMNQKDVRLLFVPHVFNKRPTNNGSSGPLATLVEDSDLAVSLEIRDELQQRWGDRVGVVDQPYESAELKWIIGHCDFFIGARMHACIAAVSQSVPTVTLAYSKKATGVMGMLDPAPPVVDLRCDDADTVVQRITKAYQDRSAIRDSLQDAVPDAQRRVQQFFSINLPKALGFAPRLPEIAEL